jgi:hypothetical protein
MYDDDEIVARGYTVTDTQIYPGAISGGNDSDSDLDLGVVDSSSDGDVANDDSADENDDEDAPRVVTRVKKSDVPVAGGSEQTWNDLSREFVSYLSAARLPV